MPQKVATKQGNTSNLFHQLEKHYKVTYVESQAVKEIVKRKQGRID